MGFEHVVITGGMGFLGYHIALRLRQDQAFKRLTIVDTAEEQMQPLVMPLLHDPQVIHIKKSILDKECFENISTDVDAIIHAAGFLGVRNVAEHSRQALDINIIGTRNCLEFAAKQTQLKRFLAFSTSEVYGPDASALDEEHPLVIPSRGRRWCYAASKVAVEQYTKAYARECSVPYSIVRPFNIYGPYRKGSNAISRFMHCAQKGVPLQINGNGSQRRAWCYVDDFVEGVMLMLNHDSATNETFNIGNPDTHCSVLNLAQIIIALTGSSSTIQVTESDVEDVRDRTPLIAKAQRFFQYAPKVALIDGLRKTLHWASNYQSHILPCA